MVSYLSISFVSSMTISCSQIKVVVMMIKMFIKADCFHKVVFVSFSLVGAKKVVPVMVVKICLLEIGRQMAIYIVLLFCTRQ